ncbi:MAG: SH3 domain-containing protein [Pseudomonadota bacterium]
MKNKFGRTLAVLLSAAFVLPLFITSVPTPSIAQTTSSINRGPSGLPLPRFVSLKSQRVNMRVGPGRDYAVAWLYLKSGLPLEIIQEYDNWRRVRDADGTTGWIHGSLLSGTRTALATPWRKDQKQATISVYKEPRAGAQEVAFLQPGVVTELISCDGAWCEVEFDAKGKTISGFASQVDLWGAYPDETIED